MKRQMTDLHPRLIASFIAVALVAFLIAFSFNPFVSFLLLLAVSGMAGVAVWEYGKLAQAKELKICLGWMIALAIAVVLSFFAALKANAYSELPLIVLVSGVVIFFLYHFKDSSDALIHLAVEFFGVCYVSVPLSFMLGVLYFPSQYLGQDGRWWLVYLLVVTKITDVGAYFVGRLWGKRRLAPILSPKKTIEGAIAGFLCAILASLAMAFLGKVFSGGTFPLSYVEALVLGILIGCFGQIGDLAESLLKRDAVVKDSNSLPGLGGFLDMLDSLLFTAPIIYFFLKL